VSDVIYNSRDIAKTRVQHRAARALAKVLPVRWTDELEFEYRYRRYQAEFGEADSDIHVSTFSKSGTTWCQIILYQLTTSGSMDFDHLFDISPWVWYAAMREVAPAVVPSPRILKSHDDYRRFRRKPRGRVIFVVRDGRDVCVSLYHHRRNFKRYEGTFDEFFEEFLHDPEYNWFDHIRPWLVNDAGVPIHYVRYEDLKRDFRGTVLKMAEFCDIPVDGEIMARTCERSSFQSMKAHDAQLGPRNTHFEGVADSPYHVKPDTQFIRRGEVGDGLAMLSEAQLAAYRKRFDETLAGFELVADYR
jgi:hypothetical protein